MNNYFKKINNSTFSKVIGLLTLVSVSLLVLVFSLYFYTRIQEKEIYKSSNHLYSNEIESLLKLNSDLYASVIVDVTYWDEFVNFTKSRDLKWFNTSVATLIDTYKVEYLSVSQIKKNSLLKFQR